MKPGIMLINPPIYDFAAYDFWLKPYGLLSVAGFLRNKADFTLFDFLDREHDFIKAKKNLPSDNWGRGHFYHQKIPLPKPLDDIPRFFRRFGLPRDLFIDFIKKSPPPDFVFIQTTMTYWYPGIREVIEDVRRFQPQAKIVLGGNYATLCPDHAKNSEADLIVTANDLKPLWDYIGVKGDMQQPALWQVYKKLKTGVLKLSDGCPFKCTYCSVPKVYGRFHARSIDKALNELELLVTLGAENIAFYDDALLFSSENVLEPFLRQVIKRKITVNFHTPNALNARFITKDLAKLMIQAGFKTFYLGFESASQQWQKQTGGKVFSEELAQAVNYLKQAGAEPQNITAYQILGHPKDKLQKLEESMHFVNSLQIRGMLADFSPVPGTADGRLCEKWVDMNEPLLHNKTAFPIISLGFEEANRLKDLQRKLNRNLPQ